MALPTLYAAKKYILPGLEEACRNIVIQNLGPDNIWTVYASTFNIPDDELTEACKRFFGSSTTAVAAALNSPKFLEIHGCLLQALLDLNHSFDDEGNRMYGVLVSEVQLFGACNAWAVAECLREGLEPSGENKRKVLGECVEQIRFKAILPVDIIGTVLPADILDQDTKCTLLTMSHLDQCDLNEATKIIQQFAYHIALNPEFNTNTTHLLEYSSIHKQPIEYSSITVRANQSLMLNSIFLFVDHGEELVREHEVFVEGKTEGKTWSKLVPSKTKKYREGYLKQLNIKDDVLLKANCEYEIKVELTSCFPCDANSIARFTSPRGEAHTVKVASQVGLDILDSSYNDCMILLLARLV